MSSIKLGWLKQTCFTWAWYEGVAFPTNHDYGHDNLLTKTQERVYTDPTAWTEAYKRLWVTNIRSRSTVNTRVTALIIGPYINKTTVSPRASAEALWCRRNRFQSSSATKWTRTARPGSACEHRDSRAGGARQVVTFSARGRGQQAKRAGGRQAAEAARHRA